jgi:hypothetical protein
LIVPRNAGAGGGRTFGVDPLGSAAVSPAERLATNPTSRNEKRTSKGRARIGIDDSFGDLLRRKRWQIQRLAGRSGENGRKTVYTMVVSTGILGRFFPFPELAHDPG